MFSSGTFFLLFTLSLLTLYNTLHYQYPKPNRTCPQTGPTNHLNIQQYRTTFLSTASNATVAAHLRRLTLKPHLAGTPESLSTAIYLHENFKSLNLKSHIENFTALLAYPTRSSLAAHFSNGTTVQLPLAEPNVPQNGVVKPYHAYSPSGSAYGKAVFLNYGRARDYHALGAEVKGCVGIVRRGEGLSRYDVAAEAAARGLSAVLMYTECGDDKYKHGVERGTVMKGVGDPLTPGWAGVHGGEKLDINDPRVTENFPGIPSLPVSEWTAISILMSLDGGSGPGPTMINFTYEGKVKMSTIHDVFAVIEGSYEPDRFVVLGNHRDAWTFGAVDPNSGTATLLEIARRFSMLMRLGWKPRRTIVLGSWDAEEFGMIGSTEWVEQNLLNLGLKAVAYLNVDCAVQGPGFFASATPQLDDLIVEVTKKVKDLESENASLYEGWAATNDGIKIQRLSRVDSDFAPFLHHAGVPSVDLYFGSDFPVYHTAFDSYDWMVNFGDPSFKRHVAMSGVWGLVALHLADDPILPFNYVSYATELMEYEKALNKLLNETISLHPIAAAIEDFTNAANEIEEEAKKLRSDEKLDESSVLRRRILNDRLMLAERGFLDSEGLPGRQWFKHLIYGPHGASETEFSFFPGIVDAISRESNEELKRETAIRHEIWRVARAIQRATCALRGELT